MRAGRETSSAGQRHVYEDRARAYGQRILWVPTQRVCKEQVAKSSGGDGGIKEQNRVHEYSVRLS